MDNLVTLFAAAVSGGIVVKLLDIAYQELRKYFDHRYQNKSYVDSHLEPFLKSADELVGKLRAHIESDFKTVTPMRSNRISIEDHEIASLIYLLCRFWSQVEIIRSRGLTNTFTDEARGKKLYSFIDCMESKRVRLLPRIVQRAIGEMMTVNHDPITFIAFCEKFNSDEIFQMWVAPLLHTVNRYNHTTQRQTLLQYGIVVHAMIDTLDAKHRITRERPSWPNKLSRKSWRALRYRVFGTYIKDVKWDKYIGPKKG